jgi:hypothetical protein
MLDGEGLLAEPGPFDGHWPIVPVIAPERVRDFQSPFTVRHMIAQLIPLDGSEPISITRDLTLVGRKRGLCDIVLKSSSVSKVHCAIAKTDGLLFVRDLGSTNGTKVNGQRVMRGALLPGDELAFASVRFRVHLGPGKPEPVDREDRTEALAAFPKLLDEESDDDSSEPQLVGVDSAGEFAGIDSDGEFMRNSDDLDYR